MKLLIIGFLMVLVSCGKSGGSTPISGGVPTAPIPTPTPGPGCKDLGSSWTATTDSESHNLSGIPLSSAAWTNYTYTGYNGVSCPGSIKIYVANQVVIDAGFDFIVEFQNNSPAVGCEFWQDGTPTSATHGSALLKLECLTITLCRDVNANAADCQEFN